MNNQVNQAAAAFREARDQSAHDRLYVSEEARRRVEEIHIAAERERRTMREEQEQDWAKDVADEKARLLLKKQQPEPRPGEDFLRGHRPQLESESELTERAERNVDQDNERAIRKTYLLEESLVMAIVREDVRQYGSERDTGKSAQQTDAREENARENPEPIERASAPERGEREL